MRRDDARIARIETVRNLDQERDVLLAASVVGISDVLASRDLALGRGHVAVRVDIGTIQRSVSAGGADVEHGPIIGPDRAAAQFDRRWRERTDEPGRGTCEARLSE